MEVRILRPSWPQTPAQGPGQHLAAPESLPKSGPGWHLVPVVRSRPAGVALTPGCGSGRPTALGEAAEGRWARRAIFYQPGLARPALTQEQEGSCECVCPCVCAFKEGVGLTSASLAHIPSSALGLGVGRRLCGLTHPSESRSPWGGPVGSRCPQHTGGGGHPSTAEMRAGRPGCREPTASVCSSPGHRWWGVVTFHRQTL